MIITQQIKSTTTKPVSLENFETINVLHLFSFKTPTEWAELSEQKCTGCASLMRNGVKWNNCKWKNLCPYLLKTDGEEFCHNSGGILFENFYQGCKVYDIVYENEVYPSRYYMNNPKY